MGCGASKHSAAVLDGSLSKGSGKFAHHQKRPTNGTTTTATSIATTDSSSQRQNSKDDITSNMRGFVPRPELIPVGSPLSPNYKAASTSERGWAVRPGYSSGASSCSGSLGEGDENEEEEELDELECLHVSRHRSNMLDLNSLRLEMQEKGDIASTVVRIETPFGMPIEQIYEGVKDGPVLGSGVAGIVRLVTHRTTGVKYAVKCLDIGLIDTMEGLRQLRNEIFIMCQLDHPNIVRIEEVYESTNEIYILQELCLGGDLFDRLDEQSDMHYTEAQCARLVKQMLSAVRYLHSKGIIHRDLKLENFLFTTKAADSELKMIDFGLSKHFESGEALHDKVGTPYTVAPEILRGGYDEKCDLWAVGVITYLLLSGETPFGGLDGENLLVVKENIMRAQVFFKPADVWDNVSQEAKTFVKRLLQADPKRRPTARQAQKDPWIQVWAKKDVKEGNTLNRKTLESLVAFKESSDMQKVLSEVLSFTLLPDQIADLRKEFELMDTDGSGEITLKALRKVLVENAEAGMLGALTEQEIVDIFDAIRIRKDEPTIRWHEFLAAGLSQARVDDRNLRLAFDRLDTGRRGYINFDDLQNLLGNSTEYFELEKMWRDSLQHCRTISDGIAFDDFKRIMKGQPKKDMGSLNLNLSMLRSKGSIESVNSSHSRKPRVFDSPTIIEEETAEEGSPSSPRHRRQRSHSHHFQTGNHWEDLEKPATSSLVPLNIAEEDEESVTVASHVSPLVANRQLYRRHREMRLAVREASKQFDIKRTERQSKEEPVQAGLIMKRGAMPPVELEDAHTRALFEAAAKRCGRSRRIKNKTVSDVTGLMRAPVN